MHSSALHRHRLHSAILLLLIALSVIAHPCLALSENGMSSHLWQHVLDIEPNRHLQQLGEISETEGALTRTYFSDAHKKAAQKILRWMEQAGMTAHVDAIGNVHGVVEGSNPELGELLVGSHYDTVVDGGKYDGALGVILAISAVKAVLLEGLQRGRKLSALQWAVEGVGDDEDIDLPSRAVKGLLVGSVRVVAFCDEEGIRFKSTFLGSRSLSGSLLKRNQLAAMGPDGLTLEEVLKRSGVQHPTEAVAALALDPKKVRGYVEFHLEQGPQLEASGQALGVVSGIAGQTWLSVAVEGVQNHGGTVPMSMRKDPMAAAAEAINAIERLCKGQAPQGDSAVLSGSSSSSSSSSAATALDVEGQALMCTVGKLDVHPNQVNIIPHWVNFTVDVRCQHQGFRQQVVGAIKDTVEAVCTRRGANCTLTQTHDAAPVLSDEALVGQLQAAVLKAQPLIQQLVPPGTGSSSSGSSEGSCKSSAGGDAAESCTADSSGSADRRAGADFRVTQDTVPVLLSGAGHDAMAIADITKIGMVFVRCAAGVSHNPAEFVDPRDVAAAAAAFATFMEMDLLDAPHSGVGGGVAAA